MTTDGAHAPPPLSFARPAAHAPARFTLPPEIVDADPTLDHGPHPTPLRADACTYRAAPGGSEPIVANRLPPVLTVVAPVIPTLSACRIRYSRIPVPPSSAGAAKSTRILVGPICENDGVPHADGAFGILGGVSSETPTDPSPMLEWSVSIENDDQNPDPYPFAS